MNRLANFKIIVATDQKNGIGKNGSIPWKIREDLQYFKNKTQNHVVIMGRKTYESLPQEVRPLPNRVSIVVSTTLPESTDYHLCSSLYYALLKAKAIKGNKDVYVIGGATIYKKCLTKYIQLCENCYITRIDAIYNCDVFFPSNLHKYFDFIHTCGKKECNGIVYNRWEYSRNQFKFKAENAYLELLRKILETGEQRGDRTRVGTTSLFGCKMEFELDQYLPVITTKKVFIKKVIGELLWIVSGSTNVKDLQERGIHFWDANASKEFSKKQELAHEEGDLGPVYGFQWRHWGAQYIDHQTDYSGLGIDQLTNLIEGIKNNPLSRRHYLNTWNVSDIQQMNLPPCHLSAQFYVRDDRYLDCQMYQRSADMFLGVPFNITSYSVLTYMIAHLTGYTPGRFIHILGDAHIYSNHVEQVKKQLSRTPFNFPTLEFVNTHNVKTIDDFNDTHIVIKNYKCHPHIKAPMAV